MIFRFFANFFRQFWLFWILIKRAMSAPMASRRVSLLAKEVRLMHWPPSKASPKEVTKTNMKDFRNCCWWLNWIWIVEWFLKFFSEKFLNWFDFKESWSFFLDDITQVLMKGFKSQYFILEDHLEIQFGKFWMEDLRNFDAEARILWKRVNAHSLILFS